MHPIDLSTIDSAHIQSACPDLKPLFDECASHEHRFWLVGGVVRSLMLDETPHDIDLCCSHDPTDFAKGWASKAKGRWFWLDPERRHSRILLPSGLTVDFSPLRAQDLPNDLQQRDFTINAMAIEADGDFARLTLIDPLNGQNDLRKGILRRCSLHSFADDPLRMIKGIRHAVTLGLRVEADTFKQMQEQASLIRNIAGERIRDELCQILSGELVRGVQMLTASNLLKQIFGEPVSAYDESRLLTALEQLNERMISLEKQMAADEDEGKSEALSNRILFLLAEFCRIYQVNDLQRLLAERLRLSRYQQRMIEALLAGLDDDQLVKSSCLQKQRQKALFMEQLEPYALEKLLFWGVCRDKLDYDQLHDLRDAYVAEQQMGRVPDLIDGRQLSRLLESLRVDQIGVYLKKLKAAEISGEVEGKEAAIDWLKEHFEIDRRSA